MLFIEGEELLTAKVLYLLGLTVLEQHEGGVVLDLGNVCILLVIIISKHHLRVEFLGLIGELLVDRLDVLTLSTPHSIEHDQYINTSLTLLDHLIFK